MAKIIIEKQVDEEMLYGKNDEGPDINESDLSAGLSFDELNHEEQLKVRKELRRFKKGF